MLLCSDWTGYLTHSYTSMKYEEKYCLYKKVLLESKMTIIICPHLCDTVHRSKYSYGHKHLFQKWFCGLYRNYIMAYIGTILFDPGIIFHFRFPIPKKISCFESNNMVPIIISWLL